MEKPANRDFNIHYVVELLNEKEKPIKQMESLTIDSALELFNTLAKGKQGTKVKYIELNIYDYHEQHEIITKIATLKSVTL